MGWSVLSRRPSHFLYDLTVQLYPLSRAYILVEEHNHFLFHSDLYNDIAFCQNRICVCALFQGTYFNGRFSDQFPVPIDLGFVVTIESKLVRSAFQLSSIDLPCSIQLEIPARFCPGWTGNQRVTSTMAKAAVNSSRMFFFPPLLNFC